jgi:release factor glutamine methyltransferase
MSASPESVPPESVSLTRSAIIARLRSAGCVFAEDEAQLLLAAARSPEDLAAMVDRRVNGFPLEHILGWAEFCGLRVAVDAGVFVPRRRTEFLVRQAACLAPPSAIAVDLCCGSGAIGTALATLVDHAELYAADIEPAAVACARRNLAPAGGQVFQGDLYEALPMLLRGRIDVLTANVPYVPTDAVELMPPEARIYEPLVALDGGADGLDILRRVAAEAPVWLRPGGCLLTESSERQAPTVVEIFARSRLTPRMAQDEEMGATVIIGMQDRG